MIIINARPFTSIWSLFLFATSIYGKVGKCAEFEAYVLICAEDLFNFTAEIKVQTHLMNNIPLNGSVVQTELHCAIAIFRHV